MCRISHPCHLHWRFWTVGVEVQLPTVWLSVCLVSTCLCVCPHVCGGQMLILGVFLNNFSNLFLNKFMPRTLAPWFFCPGHRNLSVSVYCNCRCGHLLYGYWGSELLSSLSCGKHCIDWVMSSDPVIYKLRHNWMWLENRSVIHVTFIWYCHGKNCLSATLRDGICEIQARQLTPMSQAWGRQRQKNFSSSRPAWTIVWDLVSFLPQTKQNKNQTTKREITYEKSHYCGIISIVHKNAYV